jgi:hypothetical protein
VKRESLAEAFPDVLFADGFDDAIMGVVARPGDEPFVVYDSQRCVDILIEQGLEPLEAEEHFHFNVSGGWVGPGTPGFLWRPE